MDALIMTAQLLLGLSILVGLHELGHLLAAKAFGMRVEKYSIGFPPKIWGFQYGETEYSIGAIPLGGFVKISGMIDESLDTKSLSAEPEPWEFRAKPAWQRLIVMMGGIVVNVITGIAIFIVLVSIQGENYITKEELNKHGIAALEIGQQIGLRTGDRIVKLNGQDYEKFSDLKSSDVLLGDNGYYTVERDGKLIDVKIPVDIIDKMSDRDAALSFFNPRFLFLVDTVLADTPAEKAGLQAGDKIVGINESTITYYDEVVAVLGQYKSQEIELKIERDNKIISKSATVGEDGKLGFGPKWLIKYDHRDYNFGESIVVGTNEAFNIIWVNIKAIGKMIKGDVNPSKSLSGPIGIAKIYGSDLRWDKFWRITGLLSMVLAFMNFLPIPALDGGHVMFLSYEIVSGRKPSDKFLENAQKVGMILLLGLMGFAIFNDIFKEIIN